MSAILNAPSSWPFLLDDLLSFFLNFILIIICIKLTILNNSLNCAWNFLQFLNFFAAQLSRSHYFFCFLWSFVIWFEIFSWGLHKSMNLIFLILPVKSFFCQVSHYPFHRCSSNTLHIIASLSFPSLVVHCLKSRLFTFSVNLRSDFDIKHAANFIDLAIILWKLFFYRW